ncbi:hypothetical protein OB236_03435 [Paenibacillus sp. WQ 127069]|uniref:Uncharacterized protein n=1 Tax=Paenibacillus baimaensis TaxID=2982185 RepID=A0ABT2U957_9BACL|nr:hypothetical protein [Paenibacillus sp. WQ 127069]MCU6791176.1 hypothetical protein [Paenibacillus sp. WQ 127069]
MEIEKIKNLSVDVHRLTNSEGHYFYGYYDNPSWSGNDRYHLYTKVKFWDRLQTSEDIAELGMIDVETGQEIPLAETTAWNFQQGTMLQWHPLAPNDEIIFNQQTDDGIKGVVMNVHTRESRFLERPVVNVDPTGKYALSVNFFRMYDFRPGYGYEGTPDPFVDMPHPEEDGIFRIELDTGISKLVLSLQEIWDFTKSYFAGEDQKIMINHINMNTDGTRFVCLVRNFPINGKSWKTAILTAKHDGSDLFLLSDYAYASHYHWRDPQHLVIYSSGLEGSTAGVQLYELKDQTHEVTLLDQQYFLRDGHCTYSPDRTIMLYDSYPDEDSYRHLYVYDLVNRKGVTLGSFYSYPHINGDFRCDLHPRWNRAGTALSFDSTHEGNRHIYTVDVSDVFK